MKKQLARWLIRLAEHLCKPEVKKEIPDVESYEPKQVGIAFAISKKDVRRYKYTQSERLSFREAKKRLKRDYRTRVLKAILRKSAELVEIKTYARGNETIVEGRLNVYVRKED